MEENSGFAIETFRSLRPRQAKVVGPVMLERLQQKVITDGDQLQFENKIIGGEQNDLKDILEVTYYSLGIIHFVAPHIQALRQTIANHIQKEVKQQLLAQARMKIDSLPSDVDRDDFMHLIEDLLA